MTPLRISTDRAELDVAMIHAFLSTQSYWASGIPRSIVELSLTNSICFGGFLDHAQVAFARVVSDCATFAYLGDAFVLPAWRRRGYANQLMQAVVAHPQLQGLRRFTLVTSDGHELYARFGFKALARPRTFMERRAPDVYSSTASP